MTFRTRQRRRMTQRPSATSPQKWPETLEELNALPDSAQQKQPAPRPSAAPIVPAAIRTRTEENTPLPPQTTVPRQQTPASPASPSQPKLHNLPMRTSSPFSPPLQTTPVQISNAPITRRGSLNPIMLYNAPDPAPGPPPQSDPSTANPTPRYAFSDPGVAAAQQAQIKQNQQPAQLDEKLQGWLKTVAIASTLGLPTPQARAENQTSYRAVCQRNIPYTVGPNTICLR